MDDIPHETLRVLLLVSGSVAAIKVPNIIELLLSHGCQVKVASTEAGLHFLQSPAANWSISSRTQAIQAEVLSDRDEWSAWSSRGDPVLHIELRKWAHVVLIAPLDANTLAKLAHGLCDNLVTSVMRAWEVGVKPVVLAPAMNTAMYEHPFTGPQLASVLTLYGSSSSRAAGDDASGGNRALCCVVGPVVKKLECGDVGTGALAEPSDIVDALLGLVK